MTEITNVDFGVNTAVAGGEDETIPSQQSIDAFHQMTQDTRPDSSVAPGAAQIQPKSFLGDAINGAYTGLKINTYHDAIVSAAKEAKAYASGGFLSKAKKLLDIAQTNLDGLHNYINQHPELNNDRDIKRKVADAEAAFNDAKQTVAEAEARK